ncbi:MAG: LysM peptidoglycan-binding protein [Moraxellaceae bacterium]|jgi:hypothetical protein|nr:LysM peptidoglycan-binding protein [Moraxellaceae bacterium]
MKKSLLGVVSACLLAGVVQAAEPVQVKPSAPERYTVVPGDTLWGIATRYLSDPWRWPEIWEANKQVYNPHLIYPGDILLLCKISDRTVVAVDQGGGCDEVAGRMASGTPLLTETQMANGTIKLHPKMRELPLNLAIPTLPLKDIQRYLNDSRVLGREELERAPYVIAGTDGRLVAGSGDRVFVRNKGGLLKAEGSYGVYRAGMTYVDPESGALLGYEAEDIGAGRLITLEPEVATLKVSRTTQEIRVGDKLLENEIGQIAALFHPSNPDGVAPGRILRIFDSISSASQNSVVVLNRGHVDGVKPGHTFAIYRKAVVVPDRVSNEAVKLPAERTGMAMVFRSFERVSYALVLSANSPVRMGDEVRAPN